jgi:hypothetical protein
MENGALNYDFAAKGYGGVSPAKSGQGPTRSKIVQAHRDAVGGYRKKCMQGKLCSATCIAMNKDCLVHLPIPVQREVRRAAIYIARKQGLQAGSASDIRQGITLQQMAPSMRVSEGTKKVERVGGKRVQKPRLEFDRTDAKTKRALIQEATLKESLDLQKRLPLLKGADKEIAERRILQLDAMNRGIKLPRNELEAMYDLLPEKTRNSLQNSGKATGRWYDGKDENGNDKFKAGDSGSRERGLAIFDMWMRQGGTDAYQSRGGKVFAPQDMDVEHIVPFGKGGLDAPSNWVLIRSGLNQKRRDQELESFINKLPKTEAEQRAVLANYAKRGRDKRVKELTKRAMENVNVSNFRDEDILKPSNVGLDAKQMSKLLGSYGKLRDWAKVDDVTLGGGQVRQQSTAPPMLRNAINFLYKNQVPGADRIAQDVKNTWNKELMTDASLQPQAALSKMMNTLTPHLTPSQKENVQSELVKWVKTNGKYGFSSDISGEAAPRKMNAMEAHLAKFL